MVNQRIALVVDDEKDIVELIKELLKNELKYLVLATTDPEEAVQWAEHYLFDLLILDLNMPKLDGIKVLELVRQKQPSVKVVAITGLYDRYKDRLKSAEFDLVIEKPFDFSSFKFQISNLAGGVELEKMAAFQSKIIPRAKILISDAQREQAEILKRFLLEDSPNFYEIEIATTAERTFELLREFQANVLLFDIKMFQVGALEAIAKFVMAGGGQLKIFGVLSAGLDAESVLRLKEAGCLVFEKPFRMEDLLEHLRAKCGEIGFIKKLTFF